MGVVGGGFLPAELRGTKNFATIHVADWCECSNGSAPPSISSRGHLTQTVAADRSYAVQPGRCLTDGHGHGRRSAAPDRRPRALATARVIHPTGLVAEARFILGVVGRLAAAAGQCEQQPARVFAHHAVLHHLERAMEAVHKRGPPGLVPAAPRPQLESDPGRQRVVAVPRAWAGPELPLPRRLRHLHPGAPLPL